MNFISQAVNNMLHKAGKRSYAEYFIKQLAPQDQPTAHKYFKDLYTLETAADPVVYFQKLQEFGRFVEDCKSRTSSPEVRKTFTAGIGIGSSLGGSTNMFGYKPQGTKIWNYFPNPFGVFAYFGEQYWAVGACLDLLRQEINSDGFMLKASEGVSEEKLREYYKKLTELDMDKLWVEHAVHKMLYGNFFALPHRGKRTRALVKYEILYPPRLAPIFNKSDFSIEGYQYSVGLLNRYYDADEIQKDSCASLFGRELGAPVLLSCVTEIETAMMTMSFNNNVMQKGNLLGKLVSMKAPENNEITGGANQDWVRQVQAQFDYIHSGSKAGQGVAVMSGVEAVHDMTKPGEVELNFRDSRIELDKRICTRTGIPSEKIGIPRSATAQYQPSLVENVINAQFDKTVNSYTADSARFFNKYLLQDLLHIYDAKLVPAGRYGAITLAAAQTIKELATAGPITTVNEAREKILGWEPLPPNDPRGNMVLNNAIGVDASSIPAMIAPEQLDPELGIDKIQSGKSLYIKFGGLDAGEVSHTPFKHTTFVHHVHKD